MGLSCVIWGLSWLVGLRWITNLVVISTSLWSSLDIILNLLLLFLVWISNLDSLADLSLLRSVQGIESGSFSSVFLWRALIVVRIVIDIGIVHSITGASLWRAWPWSTLGCYPSSPLTRRIICSRILRFTLNLILSRDISLILLLHEHLLFNLLLMQLLTWSQIKVINNVGNICDSILLCLGRLHNLTTFRLLETVLHSFTLVILCWLVSFVSSSISISSVIFAKITFICLLLISEVYLILLLGRDILSSKMLTSVLVLS